MIVSLIAESNPLREVSQVRDSLREIECSGNGHGEPRDSVATRIFGSASGRAVKLSAGVPSTVPRRGVTGVVFAGQK